MSTPRFVHLDGELVPIERATVSPFDRGYLFGHGVYEGLRADGRCVMGLERHIERFRASLAETRIDAGGFVDDLAAHTAALLDANGLEHAFIYWQVTAGPPPDGAPLRERTAHADSAPTVFGYCDPEPPLHEMAAPRAIRASLRPDTRWTRGHVKSISLLGNVLAAYEAQQAEAHDAIMVRDGVVSEGTATNVFARLGDEVVTPALDSAPMLAGVTRALLIEAHPDIIERPVTPDELRAADEVLLAGTRSAITSVVELDGVRIGAGEPGEAAHELLRTLRRIASDTPALPPARADAP